MSNINFNIQLNYTSISKSDGTITVTESSSFTLEELVFNSGNIDEKKIFKFSGTTTSNLLTKIATIKIEVSDTTNKMFTKLPYIIGNNNFRLKVSKVNYTNRTLPLKKGYITSFDLDLMYKSSTGSTISDLNKESTRIYFKQVDVVKDYQDKERKELTSFSFGNNFLLPLSGTTKDLKVFGIPGTEFIINVINDENESIIDTSLSNFDYTLSNGNVVKALKEKIPDSGFYLLKQKFPSALFTKRTTTTNSSASKIVLNNTLSIKPDDVVYSELTNSKLPQSNVGTNSLDKMIVASVDPDGDNENEISVTGRTLTNTTADVALTFARNSKYKVSCNTVVDQSNNFKNFNKDFILSQNLDPIYTFSIKTPSDITISRLQLSNSLTGVESASLVTTSFSADGDLKVKLRGKYIYDATETPLAADTLYMKFLAVCGSNYASNTAPSSISDFTITSDTLFRPQSVMLETAAWSGVSGVNASLTLGFKISSYGTSDADIELDLDNFFTHV